MPTDLRDMLKASGQLLLEATELTPEIVAKTDVLYCTRVQKERFDDLKQYEALKDSLIINNKVLRDAKRQMIVMHPLPRNAEIDEEVDFDQRAAYFRQVCLSPLPLSPTLLLPHTNNRTDAIRSILPHGSLGFSFGTIEEGFMGT